MKNILALDLGTNTGFALYDKKIKSGVKHFKASRFEDVNCRFEKFEDFLHEVRKNCGVLGLSKIYFEAVRRHIGTDAAHCYGGFMAVLIVFCGRNKISYQGVPVGTIKKHITGKGNADKVAVIKAIQALGFNPKDDNEADALALLDYALAQEGAASSNSKCGKS